MGEGDTGDEASRQAPGRAVRQANSQAQCRTYAAAISSPPHATHSTTPSIRAHFLGVGRKVLAGRYEPHHRRHAEEVLREEGRQAGHHLHAGRVKA